MISIIVATSKNEAIGYLNQIPWYLPRDLKHFASKTRGNTVLMGRKTYDSIIKRLGHPLPDRKNIILTTQKDFIAPTCTIVHSWDEVLNIVKSNTVFVIGGSEIYSLALPYADRLNLTVIDTITDGDVFFRFDKNEWSLISEEFHPRDEKNQFDCIFYEYERKK